MQLDNIKLRVLYIVVSKTARNKHFPKNRFTANLTNSTVLVLITIPVKFIEDMELNSQSFSAAYMINNSVTKNTTRLTKHHGK